MTSVPPSGASGSGGVFPGDNYEAEAAAMMPKGPILPADNPFVQAVVKMFQNTGGSYDIGMMQKVATQLLNSMQQSIGNSINQETQLSRARRKQDLQELLGED